MGLFEKTVTNPSRPIRAASTKITGSTTAFCLAFKMIQIVNRQITGFHCHLVVPRQLDGILWTGFLAHAAETATQRIDIETYRALFLLHPVRVLFRFAFARNDRDAFRGTNRLAEEARRAVFGFGVVER